MNIVRFAGVALLRAWLVFSVIAVLGVVVSLILDGDNLLESDDPYIVGSVFGCICACLTFVYTVAEALKKDGCTKDLIYTVVLSLWCALLWVGSCGPGEGAGFIGFFAIGSLVGGALAWLLCSFKLPNKVSAAICVVGILFVAMRIFVSVKVFGRLW